MCSLFEAAKNGWLEVACELISLGADLNAADTNGMTPLKLAIVNGHVNMVEYLISKGADVNLSHNTGKSPALIAV